MKSYRYKKSECLVFSFWPIKISRIFKYIGIHSYTSQNVIFSITFGISLLIASYVDRTLFMDGAPIGLLEHPSIWGFVIAQAILPYGAVKTVSNLIDMKSIYSNTISNDYLYCNYKKQIVELNMQIRLKTIRSQTLFCLLSLIGFAGFVWNTIQNQNPIGILNYDVWDSVFHTYGFWVAVIFKFYLWVIFIPYIVHIHFITLYLTIKIIRGASDLNKLNFQPFHHDDCGGLSVFIEKLINPILPILVMSSILSLTAIYIHKKYDPAIRYGFPFVFVLFIVYYIIPAILLKKTISKEKEKNLERIDLIKNNVYNEVCEASVSDSIVESKAKLIGSLIDMSNKLNNVKGWPHFAYVAKWSSLSLVPPVITAISKTYPFIIELSKIKH